MSTHDRPISAGELWMYVDALVIPVELMHEQYDLAGGKLVYWRCVVRDRATSFVEGLYWPDPSFVLVSGVP